MSRKLFFPFISLIILLADAQAETRMDLDGASIKGGGLPKISYIVPWQRTGQGIVALPGKGTAFTVEMTPLDREDYRRELEYFNLIHDKESDSPR